MKEMLAKGQLSLAEKKKQLEPLSRGKHQTHATANKETTIFFMLTLYANCLDFMKLKTNCFSFCSIFVLR